MLSQCKITAVAALYLLSLCLLHTIGCEPPIIRYTVCDEPGEQRTKTILMADEKVSAQIAIKAYAGLSLEPLVSVKCRNISSQALIIDTGKIEARSYKFDLRRTHVPTDCDSRRIDSKQYPELEIHPQSDCEFILEYDAGWGQYSIDNFPEDERITLVLGGLFLGGERLEEHVIVFQPDI